MIEQLQLLPGYLAAHLALTLGALLAGLLISVPLGVAVAGRPRIESLVLGIASVIQTIPSLALLAFMVPALAALGAQSLGFLPAFLGLSLYSLLPMLRNTVIALTSLDPAVIEAADSVGMTSRQKLFRVELPLALPVIIAGIRTAAVWTVGTATLSTPVGAPSLGNYIFGGLQTRNYTSVLIGCVAAALLALVLDGLIRLAESGLRQRRRLLWTGALSAFVALACWPVAVSILSGGSGAIRPVRVGAKNFTEQFILARILTGTVTGTTGRATTLVESLGSTVAFDALATDQIDLYVEYSGTIFANVLKQQGTLQDLSRILADRYGIKIAARLGFENTYGLAMRRSDANRLHVKGIGDLVPQAARLSLGTDYEFLQRAEWAAVRKNYGVTFRELRPMDPTLMYEAIRTGGVDVISAFSTDGRIGSYDLVLLDDERAAIPRYDAIVLVAPGFARELAHAGVLDALRALDGRIDADAMRSMNAQVDERGASPASVAAEFLATRK